MNSLQNSDKLDLTSSTQILKLHKHKEEKKKVFGFYGHRIQYMSHRH